MIHRLTVSYSQEVNVFLEPLNDPRLTSDGRGRLLFDFSNILLEDYCGFTRSAGD